MWEFCLTTCKLDVARFIFQSMKEELDGYQTVLTCYEKYGSFNIMFACPMEEQTRLTNILEKNIIKVICSYYKEGFLKENLCLPSHEKISLMAFKKALMNFDRETDLYIISKNLELKSTLNLDSFYDFKLKALRDKWGELVLLANENSDYLIGDDAFYDLLKFLVDNLEIKENEISVFEKENGYSIMADECFESLSNEALVSTLIELSPKKINFYCDKENSTVSFLTKIFSERINVSYNKSMEKIFS